MNAVEIQSVTKTFGQHRAVEDLSLQVPYGTIYGFIGPNGSGKTTTLRMIMGILYPDAGSGTINVLGASIRGAASDQVSYLPEERGLYKKMKVREVLRFFSLLKGRQERREVIDSWLERLGLADWGDKKVETLSKGMAQKVQFIAAVVCEPRLLILDEPFTGLDPVNAEVVKDAVMDIRRNGTTIIFSTHDMGVAEKMCDTVFMIFRGRKVLDGTLDSIQDAYGSDTIRVRVEGNGDVFKNLPGVEKVNDFGKFQELRITPETQSQDVLLTLASRARIRHFELARPSLRDIFIRIAGPEAEAVSHE
jgi:ABC-2 type transport system ATP-binding protein